MSIRIVSSADERQKVRKAMSMVFDLADLQLEHENHLPPIPAPSAEEFWALKLELKKKPFLDTVERKILLCEIQGPRLFDIQFLALCRAAKEVGDKYAYAVTTRFLEQGFDIKKREFRAIDLTESGYEAYDSGIVDQNNDSDYPFVDHVLFSPQGLWGFYPTLDEAGILGGPNGFIETFIANYRDNSIDFSQYIASVLHDLDEPPYARIALRIIKNTYGKKIPDWFEMKWEDTGF